MSANEITRPPDSFAQTGVVEKLEGGLAVIRLGDNQEVRWPADQLPPSTVVGSEIRLRLSTQDSEQAERDELAKTILNRILQNKA
ncbi:MAG TPA: hypothetical protein VGA08_03425 [Candidatus Saccharimonadales bacterium]|jgi:hypothetical protein